MQQGTVVGLVDVLGTVDDQLQGLELGHVISQLVQRPPLHHALKGRQAALAGPDQEVEEGLRPEPGRALVLVAIPDQGLVHRDEFVGEGAVGVLAGQHATAP